MNLKKSSAYVPKIQYLLVPGGYRPGPVKRFFNPLVKAMIHSQASLFFFDNTSLRITGTVNLIISKLLLFRPASLQNVAW